MSSNQPKLTVLDSAKEFALPNWVFRYRIGILVVAHAIIFSCGYILAFALRLDFVIDANVRDRMIMSMPIVVAIELICFLQFKTLHGWWRYVTFRDLLSFVKPLFISLLIIAAFNELILSRMIPRSVLVINLMTSGIMMAAVRSSWRLLKEGLFSTVHSSEGQSRAFMISTHYESLVLANQINSQQNSNTKIVGILSSDKSRVGSSRAGMPILGLMQDAPRLAANFDVTEIWLVAGSLPGTELAELKLLYDQYGLKTNVIPSAVDRNPGGGFIPVRQIEIEDLLQRSPVQLDNKRIKNEITGKTVMVTGAGGSIGSEICRQLLPFEPKKLILVDHRENSVFLIHNELGQIKNDNISLEPAVADILDRERITELFETHSPDFVYHAAAHKHVGLMELQPGVAIRNNIIGTKRIADIANDFGITKFVMVSTDKAVNPTSVMGCTKQIAERYCLSLGEYSKTKFVAVRFGNVLGSNGSVVPIFKKQIERGGPITITDERMTRFFMTIPEASQLVLQAGSMGEGGEIFVLDMGKQVKIVDLAKKMIELAGLPESAIEIQFMGARPGEKLYEELYFEEEAMIPTDHQKIYAATHRVLDYNDVLQCVATLESASTEGEASIRRLLKDYIPEYDCSGTACNAEKSTNETLLKIHADLRPELSGSAELASTADE